jgi:hypothetical protein
MRKVPEKSPKYDSISSLISCHKVNMRSLKTNNFCPASVSRTPRPARLISLVPMAASKVGQLNRGCRLTQKKLRGCHADIARTCDFLEGEQVLDI